MDTRKQIQDAGIKDLFCYYSCIVNKRKDCRCTSCTLPEQFLNNLRNFISNVKDFQWPKPEIRETNMHIK